jgi:glucokinase
MNITIDKKSDLVVAADIGGSNIRVALVDLKGNILKKEITKTNPLDGIENAGYKISKMIDSVSKSKSIKGIAYSSAGPINQITGQYINPPNLTGWHNKSLIPIIKEKLKIEPTKFIKVGHDATLAALAESKFGKNRGAKNIIYLTVSTGVGAGIISNGNVIQGENWFAGEVGHIIINPNGPSCSLGCQGCLEGSVSGTAIASIAKEKITNGVKTNILDKYLLKNIDSKIIFDYAQKQDNLSIEIINSVLENLGKGLASLLAILNPEVIILGGSVSEALGKLYWEELMEETKNFSIPFYRSKPPVQMTTLGDDASILGASIIASED